MKTNNVFATTETGGLMKNMEKGNLESQMGLRILETFKTIKGMEEEMPFL